MPSGYTAPIEKGISFSEFAMNCSRAFGAMIHMRDEDKDAKITLEMPSDYHIKAMAEVVQKMEDLNAMSDAEIVKEARSNWEESLRYNTKHKTERDSLAKKYVDMMEKVKEWQPPSEDHIEYKKFMLKQIEDSLDWDCSDYYEKAVQAISTYTDVDPREWREERKASLIKDADYHLKQHLEEIDRISKRHKWVVDLINSLDFTDDEKVRLFDDWTVAKEKLEASRGSMLADRMGIL